MKNYRFVLFRMLPLFSHFMAAIVKIIILLFIGCLSLKLQIVIETSV